jgi:predicted TIM-barrel fold metal-dependent hydrolase
MRIDIHTHLYFTEFAEYLLGRSSLPNAVRQGGTFVTHCSPAFGVTSPPGHMEVEAKLKSMDDMGLDVAVLTHGIPGPELLGGGEADDWASRINDFLAATVERYPDKFVAMGSIGFGSPERSIAEVNRCVNELGFKGFQLFSNNNQKVLDSPEFMPVYRRIAELGVPMNMHPTAPLNTVGIDAFPMISGMGFIYDTSLGAVRMLRSGLFDDSPDFRLIVPHVGGILPYLGGRLGPTIESSPHTSNPAKHYLDKLYVDTIGHSQEALDMCYKVVGADKMLLGTDHPFGDGRHIGMVDRLDCTDEEREAIYHGNAERLLGL